jgi:hypothetical protein
VPRLSEILAAIERQSKAPGIPEPGDGSPKRRAQGGPSQNMWAIIAVAIGMFFVIVGLLIGRPWERQRSGAPGVAVDKGFGGPRQHSL